VVAIDAPLVLENLDGQRPCELLISQKFGAKHASAHSSNLTKYARPTSVRLARELEARHFLHCPLPDTQRRAGRWFFEVYPHPAHVVLFQRKYIVKYKKGRIADRRTGLEEMRREVRTHCTIAEPRLAVTPTLADFLQQDLGALKGARLKEYEDTLDALLCAYLAAHNWRWAAERNEMIGDIRTGYIVNPTVAAQPGVAPDGASPRR
jgi:predicted RNase H-like nuclease